MEEIRLDTTGTRAHLGLPVDFVYSYPGPDRIRYDVRAITTHLDAEAPTEPESPRPRIVELSSTCTFVIGVMLIMLFISVCTCLVLLVIDDVQLARTQERVQWISNQLPIIYTQISYMRSALDRSTNAMTQLIFSQSQATIDTASQIEMVRYNVSTIADAFVLLVGLMQQQDEAYKR